LAVLVLIKIFYSLPHALLEYDQGLENLFTPSWETREVFEHGDDASTHPHIMAITINGGEESNTQLLRGELIPILQLMVNRLEEEGHENDAIVPVNSIHTHYTFYS
jgi:hypothetical protein